MPDTEANIRFADENIERVQSEQESIKPVVHKKRFAAKGHEADLNDVEEGTGIRESDYKQRQVRYLLNRLTGIAPWRLD